MLIKDLGDRKPKHAITDELQALVVEARDLSAANAGVRQGPFQKTGVLETVPELGLKLLEFPRSQHATVPVAVYRTRWKNLFQRMSNGHVQGDHQRKASGSSTSAEKKMISARPMKFS